MAKSGTQVLVEEFIGFKKQLNRMDKTIQEYVKSVEKFFQWLKVENKSTLLTTNQVINVKYRTVQNYIFSLREGGSALASTKKELVALQEFYKYLLFKELIEQNPCLGVQIPKDEVHVEKKFMKVSEGKQLAESIDVVRDKAMIKLMTNLGLRIQEVCNVEINNVDFGRNTLTILRKGQKWQTLPIPQSLKEDLKAWHSESSLKGNKYLFQSTAKKEATPITTMAVRNVFDKYVKANGMEGKQYHPHALRSVFAVNCRQAGLELESVQKLLNHSSAQTTMKHYLTAEDTLLAEKMGSL